VLADVVHNHITVELLLVATAGLRLTVYVRFLHLMMYLTHFKQPSQDSLFVSALVLMDRARRRAQVDCQLSTANSVTQHCQLVNPHRATRTNLFDLHNRPRVLRASVLSLRLHAVVHVPA
jgi:hypothetical protein